jgi:hypothetical protein
MRMAAVMAAVVAVGLGIASSGLAQGTPPTITITASSTELTVGATSPVAAGPTRFEVVRSGGEDELSISIAALRPGVTRAQFEAALAVGDGSGAIDLIYLDAGIDVTAQEEGRAATIALRPNSTYIVLNGTGERPSDWEISEFTVSGGSNGASAPRADASVRIDDLRFRGARTLPRNGVVRFENAGWAPHFAVTAPLRRGARPAAVNRALRANNQRRLGRLLDFESAMSAQGLITRGAVSYNELRFPKRGRYAMICFFEGHNAQGMYRIIRVR